jgi:glutamate-ammonia-ligase adenylyltransferase
VPSAILKRLATVAGLPDEKVLSEHLNETRVKVAEVFGRVLDACSMPDAKR